MKINQEHLESLIDERYLNRGKEYFYQRMVEITRYDENKISANCVGTRLYHTNLKLDNGELSGDCTCPAFDNFGPCKHMAAVGYVVMASNNGNYTPSDEYEWRKEEIEDIEEHLMQKTKQELIAIIMQVVYEDPELQWMIEREMT